MISQVIKPGDDSGFSDPVLNGQNLYWVGNAKMTKIMNMAGVASATEDLLPRDVILKTDLKYPYNRVCFVESLQKKQHYRKMA